MTEEEILSGRLDENLLEDLRTRIGADSKEQTEAATTAVVSTFVNGLKKNAESPNGLNSLLSALDRDHDGSILDDAVGFLFGRKRAENPRTTNGPGILEHILGNRQERVAEGIGRGTGLNKSQILQLMMTVAPLILGALSRAKNRNRVGDSGGGGILDILRNTSQRNNMRLQDNGLLSRLIDNDDDDSIFEDLANLGRNAFLSRTK